MHIDIQLYHYVYRITNIIDNKHYYGVRTSNVEPKLDLCFKYFSSSSNREFMIEQQEHEERFKYKVIRTFSSREEAVSFEIKLHNKFNVGVDENFYNKAIQTSTGFDMTGITGEKHHKFGTKHSAETISKMRNNGIKNRKAYTNIDGIVKYFTDTPGEDWILGNINSKLQSKDYVKNTVWVTLDGVSKRVKVDELSISKSRGRVFNNKGFAKINSSNRVFDISLWQFLITDDVK